MRLQNILISPGLVLAGLGLAGRVLALGLVLALGAGTARAGSWAEDQADDAANPDDGLARYAYPVNTEPDGWAALKASPDLSAPRLAKIYDGTLFLVIGAVPGWSHVRFKSGETGWIASRLVGCCRPASH